MKLEKLDDFIQKFSSYIPKLQKLEVTEDPEKYEDILYILYEILIKRKKYALDYYLWTELYLRSIHMYQFVNKINNIPCTLVTKHNNILPFYMTHQSQIKDTTIIHFDTHSDMNEIVNSLELSDINKKYKETKNVLYIDKAQDIVWDIGAAISGVICTIGIQNYVWMLPEWLEYDDNIITEYFLKSKKKKISLVTNDIELQDNILIDLEYTRTENLNKKLYCKLQSGKSSVSNTSIINNLINIIKTTGKNKYILDIDLDYFTCNGITMDKKQYLSDPYDVKSTKRTKTQTINEDNPRNFYESSDELKVYQKDLKHEISLINKIITKFLNLLMMLKNKGYAPSHISICDSTNVEFSACVNCNSASNGYVSKNLAFMIHKNIYDGLSEIF